LGCFVFYFFHLFFYFFGWWGGGGGFWGLSFGGGHTFIIRAINSTAAIVRMGISLAYILEYPEQ